MQAASFGWYVKSTDGFRPLSFFLSEYLETFNMYGNPNQQRPVLPETVPFRSAYSQRLSVALHCEQPSRTVQSFKDEADINVIMSRYMATGAIDPRLLRDGSFLDLEAVDYQECMYAVADAKSQFNQLDARLRARFDNDPQKLLQWVHDPVNVKEAVKLGFLDAERLPDRLKAAFGTPAPAAGAAGAPPDGQGTAAPAPPSPSQPNNSQQKQ